MNQSPVISICVPIYNGEKYLVNFLESALSQTLHEIEILCVDNHSTDASKEIICSYAENYPGKVLYFQTDHHYPSAGAGRNVAIQHARGEYLYFCDADDLITPNAMEQLYKCAVENNSDMVCGWAYRLIVDEHEQILSRSPMSYKKTQPATNEMAIQSGCEFWMRLIKKELVLSVGNVPEEFVFDDVAYVTVLNSFAKKIMFLDFPVYYYFRRLSSVSGQLRSEVCRTSVLAEQFALNNCNPSYRNVVEVYVAGRTKNNIEYRWPFFNIFAQWASEQMEWLSSNTMAKSDPALLKKLQWASETVGIAPIPRRIIVNGFETFPSAQRMNDLQKKVFDGDADLIVLGKDNCVISENPYVKRAYDRGDYALVGGYFALKEIYENGGIYIHNRVKILNYFHYYIYQNSFFTLLDKNNYSDFLFGSPANREVYADLLRTYSDGWDKKLEYPSLAERIRIILTAKYGIPLDGKPRLFQPEISVLSPDLCMVDTRLGSQSKRVICEADFSDHAGEPEYVTLKRSTLELLLSTPRGTAAETAKAKEWDKLTRSHVYKFVLLWKKIGDSKLGPLLKGIFQKLLWLRQKIRTALRK